MKKIIWSFIAFLMQSIMLASAQTNISIYRNDNTFNQIKLQNGVKINHQTINGEMNMVTSDWITGETNIPLAAIDTCEIRHFDIPVLRINFTDYPDVDCLWEKDLYLKATLDVEGNGFTEDINGASLQVKGRGNSTWGMPKKPMRLKFSSKTSLCGLKKAKNFVLLNNYLDPTLMRNAIAMWLAKRLQVPYANTVIPCHVFINNHYAGAYTLTEKLGINGASVDIEEEEGMLFELGIEFDEKYKFKSKEWDLPVMVKDPDFDELYEDNPQGPTPEERLAMWEEDFNKAEEMIVKGKGAEAFDIESAVNYTLLYQLTGNHEIGYPKSHYIHKRSLQEGEKYHFGPAWDFDVAYNFAKYSPEGYVTSSPNVKPWLSALLSELMDTPEFQSLYSIRLKELTEEIMPDLLEYIDSYADIIRPSAKINGMRWSKEGSYLSWAYIIPSFEFENQVEQLREWINKRIAFLNEQTLIE